MLRSLTGSANQSLANFHWTAAVSASSKSDLAALRKKTGYSLSICKKALSENNNDLKSAERWLKEQAQAQGWAKAQKLQGRNTSQGLLGLRLAGDTAAVVELNCETDFVARNKKFISILDSIANTSLNSPRRTKSEPISKLEISSADVSSLKTLEGSTLADLVALNIGQIGENMSIGNSTVIHSNTDCVKLVGLSHPSTSGGEDRLLYGRYVAVMAYSTSGSGEYPEGMTEERLASQICQHIIGMAPTAVVDEDDKENSLLHQAFLSNEDVTVGEISEAVGMKIIDFVRREIGRT